MASEPALTLLPGICSVGLTVLAPLVQALRQKHGFRDISVIDLSSVHAGASIDPSGLHLDITAVRGAVERLVEKQKA